MSYKLNTGFFDSENSDDRRLYAKNEGIFYPQNGENPLGSWQMADLINSEDKFMLPNAKKYNATDQIDFKEYHLEFGGNKYYAADVNYVRGWLKNPKEADFSEYPLQRPVDWVSDDLSTVFSRDAQSYINLVNIAHAITDVVDKITPVRNTSLDDIRLGIHKNRPEILKIISPDFVNRLYDTIDKYINFQVRWELPNWFEGAGIKNVVKKIPSDVTIALKDDLDLFFYVYGRHLPMYQWGPRFGMTVSAPIESLTYTDPYIIDNFVMWDWRAASVELYKETLSMLEEIKLSVFQYSTPLADVKSAEGFNKEGLPYYYNPLTTGEINNNTVQPEGIEPYLGYTPSETPETKAASPVTPPAKAAQAKTDNSNRNLIYAVLAAVGLAFL